MLCPACGNDVRAGAKRCMSCGAKLAETSFVQPAVPLAEPQPVTEEPAPLGPAQLFALRDQADGLVRAGELDKASEVVALVEAQLAMHGAQLAESAALSHWVPPKKLEVAGRRAQAHAASVQASQLLANGKPKRAIALLGEAAQLDRKYRAEFERQLARMGMPVPAVPAPAHLQAQAGPAARKAQVANEVLRLQERDGRRIAVFALIGLGMLSVLLGVPYVIMRAEQSRMEEERRERALELRQREHEQMMRKFEYNPKQRREIEERILKEQSSRD